MLGEKYKGMNSFPIPKEDADKSKDITPAFIRMAIDDMSQTGLFPA